MTAPMLRRCVRDANSGTTPPNLLCTSSCDATMLDNTVPSSSTAAAVSSHELSTARMRITEAPPWVLEIPHHGDTEARRRQGAERGQQKYSGHSRRLFGGKC